MAIGIASYPKRSFHTIIDITQALIWLHLKHCIVGDVGPPLVGDAVEGRPWGTDLLRDSIEKVKSIQEKLLAA